MKQFILTSILIAIVATMLLYLTACSDDECTELQTKNLSFTPITYLENQELKFLHNNTDTHTFKTFNKQSYYVYEEKTGNEGSCPTQYQGYKVQLTNMNTSQIFSLQYERDKSVFSRQPSLHVGGHEFAYYKFSGPGVLYYKEIAYFENGLVDILGKKYNYVKQIGLDTGSNYIFLDGEGIGIVRIKIKGENWDLIPK